MHAPLNIHLLGAPWVSTTGEPFVIPRRQVRALLYRLASELKPLSRSYLGYLFWADCPESSARKSLSRLLVYLRKALPISGIIMVDDTQVYLAPEQLSVDTCLFDRHWEAWKTNGSYRDLQEAVSLYRGAFLDGFYLPGNVEFNAWVLEQAEYWQQQYLRLLSILVDKSSQWGDHILAIDYANQYLACNELAEDIHRKLIELYTACGDRSAAICQYERCSTILERELGVKPSPETYSAYQAVLNLESEWNTPPIPTLTWTLLPSLQVPIVGRKSILARLESQLSRVRAGNGGMVFIIGEPGIGKTRLMKEFSGRSRLKTRVLAASAESECSNMPYQPLVDAIRPALNIQGIIDQIPAVWIGEAARLFPELSGVGVQSTPPEPHNTDETRGRLFEALYRIISCLTSDGYCLLLCLDDLQWADRTTLDWLAYLSRRISNQRILVLGSCRPDDNAGLSRLRRALERQENCRELTLEGLSLSEIHQLVGYLDGVPALDTHQIDQINQATGGNPFFLLETLRVLIDRPQTSGGQDYTLGKFPLPETVQAAVSARLNNLHPKVRQVLEAASVLGTTFTYESVHLTSGRQEFEILDGLDELVARQFLIELPSGYQFCHAITREAVYAGMSYWRRKRLHFRAGMALERLQSNDWSSLAWHFEQTGEPGKAADYALRAGQSARSVFAHTEAREYFEHGLALLEQEAGRLVDAAAPLSLAAVEDNCRKRIQLLYERGWALRLLGDMQAYTQDLEEVTRLAIELNDAEILAHLRWQEAYNHRWFCRYAQARCAAEAGLQVSRQIQNRRLEALCQRELGMAARETGDYELAQRALEGALDLFAQLPAEAVYMLHTLGNLSTLYCRRGDGERAMQLAQEALELCDRLSLPYERRLPLGDLGAASTLLGAHDFALQYLQESLSIAQQVADRTQVIYCLGHLGKLQLCQGRFQSGRDFLLEALNLAEEIGSLAEQSWLHLGLAQAHAGLGEQDLALIYATQAQVIAQKHCRLPDAQAAQEFMKRLKRQDTRVY